MGSASLFQAPTAQEAGVDTRTGLTGVGKGNTSCPLSGFEPRFLDSYKGVWGSHGGELLLPGSTASHVRRLYLTMATKGRRVASRNCDVTLDACYVMSRYKLRHEITWLQPFSSITTYVTERKKKDWYLGIIYIVISRSVLFTLLPLLLLVRSQPRFSPLSLFPYHFYHASTDAASIWPG
jgi:hypothetical protein